MICAPSCCSSRIPLWLEWAICATARSTSPKPPPSTTLLRRLLFVFLSATAALDKITEVLDEQPQVRDRPGSRALPQIDGHVRFDHVRFGYGTVEDVLHDLDLDVPAGTTVDTVASGPQGEHTLLITADLSVVSAALPGGTAGAPYSATAAAAGGTVTVHAAGTIGSLASLVGANGIERTLTGKARRVIDRRPKS